MTAAAGRSTTTALGEPRNAPRARRARPRRATARTLDRSPRPATAARQAPAPRVDGTPRRGTSSTATRGRAPTALSARVTTAATRAAGAEAAAAAGAATGQAADRAAAAACVEAVAGAARTCDSTPCAAVLIAATLWVALAAPVRGFDQTFFYSEIERDGRIDVFADAGSCDLFQKGGEMGTSITRPSYGPNGETVLFDSEEAISLYNFKHGLPGESFPQPEEKPEYKPKSPYPSGKLNGLVFGDYYWFSHDHDPRLDGQQGFAGCAAPSSVTTTRGATRYCLPTARDEQQRPARGRGPGALREGRLRDVEVPQRAPGATRDPQPSLTFDSRGGVLGPAAHREDAGRPLPDRLLARSRPGLERTDRRAPAMPFSSATTWAMDRRRTSTRSSGSTGSSKAGPACCSRAISATLRPAAGR